MLTFCDESGRTLGYYVPAPDQRREMYEWARTRVYRRGD